MTNHVKRCRMKMLMVAFRLDRPYTHVAAALPEKQSINTIYLKKWLTKI